MDVLVVCRANVCRSRVAEGLLTEPLRRLGASVTGAGVDAADSDVACADAAAYLQDHHGLSAEHPPRQLTAAMAKQAGLILTAEASVTAMVAEMCPSARPRVFRLLWAATALPYVAGFVAAREVPPGAPPMPDTLDARWAWLVNELDATRGQLPAPGERGAAFYDVLDPHAEAVAHADALDRIAVACEQIARAAYVVLDTAVLSPT
jgi:protein-tyrosine-phosphatase